MSKRTGIDEAIEVANGPTALAEALTQELGEVVSPQVVTNWAARGVVAPNRCKAVERITGISVKKLRPNDWRDYWPELAKA